MARAVTQPAKPDFAYKDEDPFFFLSLSFEIGVMAVPFGCHLSDSLNSVIGASVQLPVCEDLVVVVIKDNVVEIVLTLILVQVQMIRELGRDVCVLVAELVVPPPDRLEGLLDQEVVLRVLRDSIVVVGVVREVQQISDVQLGSHRFIGDFNTRDNSGIVLATVLGKDIVQSLITELQELRVHFFVKPVDITSLSRVVEPVLRARHAVKINPDLQTKVSSPFNGPVQVLDLALHVRIVLKLVEGPVPNRYSDSVEAIVLDIDEVLLCVVSVPVRFQ
ncbi:hypothetical protein WICPIJ_001111 [Wickerhamomyces pijperi]|uniref:Uncharacterized protein n=1 Tax=Wickerhamomyces pijperi TaxID=599730 RepID=A0A9P8QEN5_WICPI|nr:hypothetical protein WICPIJ_001111 [Wickerhamomyces pijperi]